MSLHEVTDDYHRGPYEYDIDSEERREPPPKATNTTKLSNATLRGPLHALSLIHISEPTRRS